MCLETAPSVTLHYTLTYNVKLMRNIEITL